MRTLLFYTLLITCLYGCGAEKEENLSSIALPTTLDKSIGIAYKQGKGILLFGYNDKSLGQHTAEDTYSDWASYLDEFREETLSKFITHRITPESLKRLIGRSPNSDDFSLFIKKGEQSFFYDDIILEPQVYQAVINTYAGKKLTQEDQAFIPESIDLTEYQTVIPTPVR